MGDPSYPTPRPDEDVLTYAERLWEEEDSAPFSLLEGHFGLGRTAAKSISVASANFNARFSFKQWTERRKNSRDEFGPRMWLQRKYKLDEPTAKRIAAEFEAGNETALSDILGFVGLARCRLSDEAQASLEEIGLIPARERLK